MEPPSRNSTQAADTFNEPDTPDLPSCEGCRKRKLKCSRQLPLCTNCERLDTPCVYDGKKTKPGVKTGAVESLNKRLEIVENALLAKQQELERQGETRFEGRAGQKSPTQPISGATTFQGEQNQVVDVLSSLSKEIHKLSSAITSNSSLPNFRQNGPSDSFQDHHDNQTGEPPHKRRRVYDTTTVTPELSSYGDHPKSESGAGDYCSSPLRMSQLEGLLNVFFNRVQPWVPMLHIKRFPKLLEDPVQRKKKSVVLHAIQVATLRHLRNPDDSPLDSDYVAREVKRSRDYVVLSAMDGLSVENLQALILVAFTDIGNGTPHKAWPIIGSLTRTVEYLQLTVEAEDSKQRGDLLQPMPALSRPKSWVEQEERRRVFWNIFNLDRFCSVTTGSNTSLTAADVSRRLPVCGGIWYEEKPATTPYFGIWDRSAAKIGNSITFLPEHYPSPSQTTVTPGDNANEAVTPEQKRKTHKNGQSGTQGSIDMSNIGAFAYYVESLESLSRITTYFLQQHVDFTNRQQLTAWLTRFKELDLRLVHWKMFLPHQWKDSGMSRELMPGVMDPNMTIAHTTHNTSMILLHQRIAYPTKELMSVKLPSLYSAETCQSAAAETATITKKYLELASPQTIISPQMAFAAFVSARVLLVHSRYYRDELAPEFWALISNLEDMHRCWVGPHVDKEEPNPTSSLFAQFATRLRGIHDRCQREPSLTIDVSGQFDDLAWEEELLTPGNRVSESSPNTTPHFRGSNEGQIQQNQAHHDEIHRASGMNLHAALDGSEHSQPWQWPQTLQATQTNGTVSNRETDDLSAISQILMDQQFMDMDRVISFEDMMHPSWDARGGTSLETWTGARDAGSSSAANNGQEHMF